MKFETVLLNSFFAVCMLLCVAVMGAMLVLPTPTSLAANHARAATLANAEG
ncbi:hypothetical protein [Frateuria terrea]|uniref:Uncharacterized protein n=1 Tax=Frateuria terrea TaxID=529704 RepID=A0A1H6R116_9GAMM|nr:hypothetical protein [Frateuria terrea]SEI46954.1 hypothetical protein SAMN04487997_0835 [Frateuria terrea]SFP12862.1 hypothetical protein SAMN02927913_0751 [Frateuria terrea]